MSPFQRFIGAVVLATAIGTSIGVPVYVTQQGGGGGGGGTGPGSANVWIASTSTDPQASDSTCSFSASPIADPGGQGDCVSPQKACNLAVAAGGSGVVVMVVGGTYSAGFNLNGCNPATTVTFVNQPGQFVAFAGASTITATSNVTLQGDQVGHGVGFSLGYTAFTSSTGAVTNVLLNDVNVYCANTAPWNVITSGLTGEVACNASMQFVGSGVNGVTWNGGDESDWATCLTSCTHTGTVLPIHNTIEPGPSNITIEHVSITHYFDLDNNGSAGDHSEAWMIRDNGPANNIIFLDDRFVDCSPPPSTGYAVNNSCNSAFVFFGQSGSSNTTDGVTFIQTIIAPGGYVCTGCNPNGAVSLQFAYDVPAGNESHLTFLYDTIDGGLTTCGTSTNNKCGPGTGSTFTGSNTTWVGNAATYQAFGNCYPSGIYSHNVWFTLNSSTAAKCSTSTDQQLTNTTAATLWVSPRTPSFDYTPLAALQGKGENAFCPATDINGKARPTSTPCDAGAVQH